MIKNNVKDRYERSFSLYIFALCIMCVCLVSIPMISNAEGNELQALLEERTSTIWVEGQQLGNMVIGSRVQIGFIFVDRKLLSEMREDPDVPQWLSWHSQHYTDARKKKKALFIVRFKTFKPWNFNVSKISIGGYTPCDDDVITRKAFRPEGDIPSDFKGSFALMVPLELVGKGKEMELSCDGFSSTWKVPR